MGPDRVPTVWQVLCLDMVPGLKDIDNRSWQKLYTHLLILKNVEPFASTQECMSIGHMGLANEHVGRE